MGCDLDPDSTVNTRDRRPAAPGCSGWQQKWRSEIDRTDPDVVAVELGRWEVSDRIVDGAWTQIGQPAWDHLYASELSTAIQILSSRGAHVVIFTLPYIQQTTEAPDGTPWDINQPSRTDAYNALVKATVARHPRVASVIDLNHMLDPAGSYTYTLHGVDVRDDDQEHISVYGGMLLRPMILPTLVRLGLHHEQTDVAQSAAWFAAELAAAGRGGRQIGPGRGLSRGSGPGSDHHSTPFAGSGARYPVRSSRPGWPSGRSPAGAARRTEGEGSRWQVRAQGGRAPPAPP